MELAIDLLDFLVDFFLFVEMPPSEPEVQEHLVPTKGGVGAVAEGAAGEAAKNKREQCFEAFFGTVQQQAEKERQAAATTATLTSCPLRRTSPAAPHTFPPT